MKKRIIRIPKKALSIALALSVLLSVTSQIALGYGAGESKYIHTQALATNLNYVNTVYWNDVFNREESYSLEYQAGGDAYPVIMKDDTVYGTVTIDEAVAYAKSIGYNVLGGMNAGFFAASGVPLGLFIENGIYKSSPAGLPAVVFLEDGSAQLIQSPDIVMTLTNLGDGLENINAGKSVSVKNLNKMRNVYGGMYMFSSDFSTVSTRTSGEGWFIRFEILEGQLTASGEVRLRVAEMFESDEAVPIGEGFMILSAGGAPGEDYAKFSPGDEVTLITTCSDEALALAKSGTGTGDIIVSDGTITDSSLWDKDLLERHPRTALGVKADGTVVSYVLDGRNATFGTGLPLMALAEEMLRQGCVWAVNLDGGGSSVMSVQLPGAEGMEVVNRPSDGKARKSSLYILFVTNNVSDMTARNLSLSNDGTIVLTGSSFELGYTATDSAYRPIGAPDDISAASTALGSVSGNTYTAGPAGGIDKVQLYSAATGASGTGEVFVLTSPTSITAYGQTGTALTNVSIALGGTLQLSPVATYYRKAVIAQPGSFIYSVTGDIGTVTEDGVFTATTAGVCKGSIVITAGTTSISLPVTVQGFTDTQDHWAKEFIDELYANGIVSGVTVSTYAPGSNIKRGDFVLMLYRAAGQPDVTGALDSFTDVPPDSYYATAIAWAKETGITTGVSDDLFDPVSNLTREQAFALVYRALNVLKIEVPAEFEPTLGSFTDGGEVSEYAVQAAETLIALGIVGGSDGRITPSAPLTRAQMAKILCVTLRLPEKAPETEPEQPQDAGGQDGEPGESSEPENGQPDEPSGEPNTGESPEAGNEDPEQNPDPGTGEI